MSGAPSTTDFTVDVSDDDVAFFREHGYLAVERITTDEELDWLREVYDDLYTRELSGLPDGVFDLSRPYGSEGEPALGQLLFPERRVPELHETTLWRNARRIAARLLGHEAGQLDSWGHLICKAARHGAETPWHQDEAYWDGGFDYRALAAWAPLDDATVENGCLWFVPGSHRGEVLPHRHLHDDPAVHVLVVDTDVDTSTAVPVPVPAGGVSFHAPRTLHYAGPNRTDRGRRAWANEFQTSPVARDEVAERPWVDEGNRVLREHFKAKMSR